MKSKIRKWQDSQIQINRTTIQISTHFSLIDHARRPLFSLKRLLGNIVFDIVEIHDDIKSAREIKIKIKIKNKNKKNSRQFCPGIFFSVDETKSGPPFLPWNLFFVIDPCHRSRSTYAHMFPVNFDHFTPHNKRTKPLPARMSSGAGGSSRGK